MKTNTEPSVKTIRKYFSKLRKDKDYVALGQMFWDLFLTLPNGRTRTAVSRMWNSLSKAEKNKCESV